MPSFKNWWARSYQNGQERVLLHVFFWFAYLSFLSSTAYEHLRISNEGRVPTSLLIWLAPVFLIWVYYFFIHTAYAALPKRQHAKAFAATVVSLLIYAHSDIVLSYVQELKLSSEGITSKRPQVGDFGAYYEKNLLSWFALFHFLFGFVVYMVLPVLCKFFRDLERSHEKYRELKGRNMQLELNLIKSQVNPHFLLNTLNNIYGFTINGTKQQIGEMVLHLSDFLKYSLYECNSEFVPLSKEIRVIQSYVELEQVRSDLIEVSFDVHTDSDHYNIPPFILSPLVENAFKHGTRDLTSPTQIHMELCVQDGELNFQVENDVQPGEPNDGGFGLPALRKKIEYYYPRSSSFSTSIEKGRYIAKLKITGLCPS